MTQVIAAITQEYALFASDRCLTFADGRHRETACKLVNLCGTTGIGYSGVAEMNGRIPTDEWIAKTLAEAGCIDAPCAERTLANQASASLPAFPRKWRHLNLVFAGWAHFGDVPSIRPYYAVVSNTFDASGEPAPEPLESFNSFRRYLRPQENLLYRVVGEPLVNLRAENLVKNLGRLIKRDISPKEALRLLVDEVICTSKYEPSVGSKVLGFCIPRKAAQHSFEKRGFRMLATQPNADTAAFTYFEEGYSALKQHGPTTICGEMAVTDVKTENDPSRNYQSSEFRILSLPKGRPSGQKS